MKNILTSAASHTRSGLTCPLLVTTALMGVMGPVVANAANLTLEQQAIVAKYHMTEADQAKLFKSVTVQQETGYVEAAVAPTRHYSRPVKKDAGPLSGTYVWLGADTYKSVGDRITNINGGTGALTGSFGSVVGFNSGFALGDSDVGIQAGASLGIYDWEGRLGVVPDSAAVEKQLYYTVGAYKRANTSGASFGDALSLGLVYDGLYADHWGVNSNTINLGQVRGTVGVAVTPATELGLWGAVGVVNDTAAVTVAGAPGVRRTIHGATQGNLYVKHQFEFGGEGMAYAGLLGGIDLLQVGVIGKVPLNDSLSMFGSANYAVPRSAPGPNGSGEEQFSASVGLTYYFGGNGAGSENRNLPLLDVASNRTFLITD